MIKVGGIDISLDIINEFIKKYHIEYVNSHINKELMSIAYTLKEDTILVADGIRLVTVEYKYLYDNAYFVTRIVYLRHSDLIDYKRKLTFNLLK